MWDGGSPSYYTHNWDGSTDYRVWSPQVEFMNLVFMQKQAYQLNPEFWYEFSVWDGYEPGEDNDKRLFYRDQGQAFTPERYGGFVQFGMWLTRPRAVREHRDWNETWQDCGPFFMALVAAVDRAHTNATLREWWRYGELVPNGARLHPYQQAIPEEYQSVDRWFLLETDANSPGSLSGFVDSRDSQKEIRVFALALARGSAPERKWLVYAHSPLAERDAVQIRVPGYGDITVHVSVAGSFYLVDERTRSTTPVSECAVPAMTV
jgi:hypothetical protein